MIESVTVPYGSPMLNNIEVGERWIFDNKEAFVLNYYIEQKGVRVYLEIEDD